MRGCFSNRLWVGIVVMTCCLGCGSRGPKTVRVSGIVEFDGQPLTKGRIAFVPQAGGEGALNRPATGTIDSKGHFELSTFKPGDGAVPGKYFVAVFSNSAEPTLEEAAQGAKTISAIPGGYNDPRSSGLTATVNDSGAMTIDFKLKTGGAPDAAPQQQGMPAGGVDQFGT
jgi:hypothetical protein